MMSDVQGGNFWTGFASGALSSIASSAWGGGYINKTDSVWKGVGGAWGGGSFGTIAFGTVSGGAGAALTGGNFWQGAATGLTVSLLNHVAHGGFAKKDSEFIVMHDEEGASGHGHTAAAAGNDKKGWIFVSKDGRADFNKDGNQEGTLFFGGESTSTYDDTINTKAELLKKYSQYESIKSIKATYINAMKAINTVYSSAKSYYHILFNNCGTAVAKGLEVLGRYGGEAFEPNMRFHQIIVGKSIYEK